MLFFLISLSKNVRSRRAYTFLFFTLSLFWSMTNSSVVMAQQAEVDVLIAEAILAYDDQKNKESLALIQRALQLDPNNVRGLYYQGLNFLDLQQYQFALKSLEKAYKLRPDDIPIRYQLGLAHLGVENFSQATHFLEGVFKTSLDRHYLPYYVGYLRFFNKNYSGALQAFDAVETKDPTLTQLVSFYRGMCLGFLGLSDQAIVELEHIRSMDSTIQITSASTRLRDALAARRHSSNRFRFSVSVGGGYDDNVLVNPNKNSNATVRLLRSRKTTSGTLFASALADYSWYRNGPIEGTIRYSFFQTLNLHHGLSSLNFQNHLIGAGAFYRGALGRTIQYQLGIDYSYDYSFLDHDGFLSRHLITFSPTVVWPSSPMFFLDDEVGHLTVPLLRYQVQNFFREIGDHSPIFQSELRDGYTTTVGFLHLFRFSNDRFIIRLGYQYDSENTEGSAFSYRGNRILTGAQFTLPWGDLSLQYNYDIHWRHYKNSQSIFLDNDGKLSRRSDVQQIHLAQLVKPLWWNLSWTLQYQGIRNHSNIPTVDFSKNVFSTFLTWKY